MSFSLQGASTLTLFLQTQTSSLVSVRRVRGEVRSFRDFDSWILTLTENAFSWYVLSSIRNSTCSESPNAWMGYSRSFGDILWLASRRMYVAMFRALAAAMNIKCLAHFTSGFLEIKYLSIHWAFWQQLKASLICCTLSLVPPLTKLIVQASERERVLKEGSVLSCSFCILWFLCSLS